MPQDQKGGPSLVYGPISFVWLVRVVGTVGKILEEQSSIEAQLVCSCRGV